MSSFASTFTRVVTRRGQPLRDPLRDVEDAVDAKAHDEASSLRLEVDVAGPVLGRLEDDRVHEPYERALGDAVIRVEVVRSVLIDDLELRLVDDRASASFARASRRSSSRTSSLGATANSTGRPAARRSSSMPWMFSGSVRATRSAVSSTAYGTATTRSRREAVRASRRRARPL
jgi:hypothetical protein